MKKTLLTFLAAVMTLAVMGIPAKRQKTTLTLADGTKVEAMLVGDEHGHWYIDGNGAALQIKGGVARYMTSAEFAQLKETRMARVSESNARRLARMEARRLTPSMNGARRAFGEPTTITGSKKGLIILVNFSDKSFKSTNTRQVFDDRFNKEGYSATNYVGSVHDYFYDQSYGQFNLTFDVVGPVTVSNKYSYYGANDNTGNDKYPATLAQEALKLANTQVNYADYDWDGDGEVDQVFFIYAGTGEAASETENDIWPHEWNFTEAEEYGDGTGAMTLDGVKLDTYAMSCELAGSGSTIDGIGTACHEFSHCLGYADLYDPDYSGGQGMMYWDLLDAGSYNGPDDEGEVPAPYTSFERIWAGWMTPVELSEPCKVEGMKALTSEPTAYIIYNQAHKDEYYLLENHQEEKWDEYTGGHGMMILHVDYDKTVWQNNGPNDTPSRQRMTYFPADNNYGTKKSSSGKYYWSATYTQLAGDPWPGTGNKTSFTDSTTPAATLYNSNSDGRKYMGKPIEDIAESSDGLISFKFDGGVVIPTPEVLDATNIAEGMFTANWKEVDGATSYNLEVVEKTASGTSNFTENFSKIKATTDGTVDISGSLDSYTQQTGWTSSKVYLAAGGLKLGSGSATGYVQTPEIDAPADGNVTVKIDIKDYVSSTTGKSDASSVQVSLLNASKSTIGAAQTVSIGEGGDMEFSFTGITSNFMVKFANTANKKRFYLYSVDIEGQQGQKYNFTGITTTSYIVSDLTSTGYRYRVQAVTADGTSAWSEYKDVAVPMGIDNLPSAPSPQSTTTYTISGQRVQNTDRPGIYIQNGHKILK